MDDIKILYEDNHILVVVKKPNIPSQADKTGDKDMLSILKEYLVKKYHKKGDAYLGLVHRLDRPVGGVMVFAKTSKAAARLSEQVREKQFKKEYLAIVDGSFKNNSGTLENYILKNERTNTSKIVEKDTPNAKYAKLEYEVLGYNPEINLSVVKIKLYTGRHHQIRVQMANIGHSLCGDQKYGTRGRGKQIGLWACTLSFLHPITKECITFYSIPDKIGSWKILEGIELSKMEFVK